MSHMETLPFTDSDCIRPALDEPEPEPKPRRPRRRKVDPENNTANLIDTMRGAMRDRLRKYPLPSDGEAVS